MAKTDVTDAVDREVAKLAKWVVKSTSVEAAITKALQSRVNEAAARIVNEMTQDDIDKLARKMVIKKLSC